MLQLVLTSPVHYPNNSDQVGCLHFKLHRKCSLFGDANEGLCTQVTYLIDEIVDCEKGSNAVISYIHDYLNNTVLQLAIYLYRPTTALDKIKQFFHILHSLANVKENA